MSWQLSFTINGAITTCTVTPGQYDKFSAGSVIRVHSHTNPLIAGENIQGYDSTQHLILLLIAEPDQNAIPGSAFTFNLGKNQCSGGTDCKEVIGVVYRNVQGSAAGTLGHDRSGSKVKDDMGGGTFDE